MPPPLKNPAWPECPEGVNPFAWILRTAPRVREARRQAAGQYRSEHRDAQEDPWRPAERPARPQT